jgi:hypothetical protein
MIIFLKGNSLWWAGIVCVVVGRQLLTCYSIVILPLGCEVGPLVLLGFSGS